MVYFHGGAPFLNPQGEGGKGAPHPVMPPVGRPSWIVVTQHTGAPGGNRSRLDWSRGSSAEAHHARRASGPPYGQCHRRHCPISRWRERWEADECPEPTPARAAARVWGGTWGKHAHMLLPLQRVCEDLRRLRARAGEGRVLGSLGVLIDELNCTPRTTYRTRPGRPQRPRHPCPLWGLKSHI